MISTPIYDFISAYGSSSLSRFHVPGHKGIPLLGPEQLDLTEVQGADDLYAPEGIIAESQQNASSLFGTKATFYSVEGSSLCIRAIVHLLLAHRPAGTSRSILAARNVHRSFVSAVALLDAEVTWLYPESSVSPLNCIISPSELERTLTDLPAPPSAVWITSPDYLGAMQDISALAEICHRHNTRLAVDNAHGAYLHFLPAPAHPMDLGADICCDSAHKTLPVLTGGAYLHLSSRCPDAMVDDVPSALSLFGSSSPSYLILASLDLANQTLASDYPERLPQSLEQTDETKASLSEIGWSVLPSDPLRITIRTDGAIASGRLRSCSVEPEYTDREHVVLMASPGNTPEDHRAILAALGSAVPALPVPDRRVIRGIPVLSIREALLGVRKTVSADEAAGCICAGIFSACPPAVPLVMPGERIPEEAVIQFHRFGIRTVPVLQ